MSLSPGPQAGVELCATCALAPEWDMCDRCRRRMAEFHGEPVDDPPHLRHRPTTWERLDGGEER